VRAGKLWSDSDERGVYKTTDGGKTWAKVLKGANLSTGCSMLAMDPSHPKTLFAGMWDSAAGAGRSGREAIARRRRVAPACSRPRMAARHGPELSSAGASGLPSKPWGRVAVTVAPSKPEIVVRVIEAVPPQNALYRSENGGKTWQMLDRSQNMLWRPFYFANSSSIRGTPNRVYKTDGGLIVSTDGGKSFSGILGRRAR